MAKWRTARTAPGYVGLGSEVVCGAHNLWIKVQYIVPGFDVLGSFFLYKCASPKNS